MLRKYRIDVAKIRRYHPILNRVFLLDAFKKNIEITRNNRTKTMGVDIIFKNAIIIGNS